MQTANFSLNNIIMTNKKPSYQKQIM